jgi:hypothetical protein
MSIGGMGRTFGRLDSSSGGAAASTPPSLSTTTFTDGDFMGRTIATVTPTTAVLTDDASGQFSLSGGLLRLEKLGTAGNTYNPKINGVTVPISCSAYSLPASLKMRINATDTTKLWQDSTGTTAVTTNGNPVGRVLDLVSGWEFTQATSGARPTYDTSTFARPCFNFDGADDFWSATTAAAIGYLGAGYGSKKFTIVAVWQIPDASANRELLGWGTSTLIHGLYRPAAIGIPIPGVLCGSGGATASAAGACLPVLGSPHIHAVSFDGAPESPLVLSYLNGQHIRANASTPGTNLAAAQLGAITSTIFNIGRRASTASGFFKGKLLDILIFDETLGYFEMQNVHALLGAYWGITVNVSQSYIDTTQFDATRRWQDDFTTDQMNSSFATDTNATGWLPGYPGNGLGRSAYGTKSSLSDEQGWYIDMRNSAFSGVTSPYTVQNSILKIQSAALPAAVGGAWGNGTGTLSVTGTSTAVTGVGTAFLTQLASGMRLKTSAGIYFGTVASVADDTHLTLVKGAVSTVSAGSSFRYSDPSIATKYAATGTITCTTGSATVTGVGTAFSTEIPVGFILHDNTGAVIGTVLAVTNSTSLTLYETAYVAVTAGTFKYSNLSQDMMFMSHGRVTQGWKDSVYGNIEIRCKFPNPQLGAFAAFWTENSTNRWPPEVDIFETFPGSGTGSQVIQSNTHIDPYGFANTGSGAGAPSGLTGATAAAPTSMVGDTFNKEHHLINFVWTPSSMKIAIDRKICGTVPVASGVRTVSIATAGSGAGNGTTTIFCEGGQANATASLVVSGGAAASVTIIKSGSGFDHAQGYIDFSANLSAGDTVTVGSQVFTLVASGAVNGQVNVGVNLATTLASLVTAINTHPNTCLILTSRFSVTSTRLNVMYYTAGGTSVALSTTSGVGTASGATLALMTIWYTSSTMDTPVGNGITFTTDASTDTVYPLQFHDPIYLLLALQLGSISGALNTANGYPALEVDYIRWDPYKPATPATITRGFDAVFDAGVDAIVANIKTGLQAGGQTVNAAREQVIQTWVQAMKSWQVRYDTTPLTNMSLDWDNTKLSLWDACDLIYAPFLALDKQGAKINMKNYGTNDLIENGVGIAFSSLDGSLSLPGTSGVYLNSSLAIASTQFANVDNHFEIFLSAAPTNASLANLMGFNTNARWDASATAWDSKMHGSGSPSGFITNSKVLTPGHYVHCRGWRPMMHLFRNGEVYGAGFMSGNDIQSITGSFKLGSYDGSTAGAAFSWRVASVGRRLAHLETQKLNDIHRAAMISLGLTSP